MDRIEGLEGKHLLSNLSQNQYNPSCLFCLFLSKSRYKLYFVYFIDIFWYYFIYLLSSVSIISDSIRLMFCAVFFHFLLVKCWIIPWSNTFSIWISWAICTTASSVINLERNNLIRKLRLVPIFSALSCALVLISIGSLMLSCVVVIEKQKK